MTNSIPAAEGTLCQTGSIEKGVSKERCAHSPPMGESSSFPTDISPNKITSTIFNTAFMMDLSLCGKVLYTLVYLSLPT